MRKVTISVILFLIASFALHGQLLPSQVETQDVTLTKDFKAAKSTFIGGLVTAGVGALANLAGNAICVIEQNRYTNSHTSSGSVDEILRLNQEAKQQPAYKKGQIWEIAGFAGMLAGGGVAWYGGSKMRKSETQMEILPPSLITALILLGFLWPSPFDQTNQSSDYQIDIPPENRQNWFDNC